MIRTDILFAMTGDVYRNARALKQIRSLAAEGYSIRVLALEGEAPPTELPAAVHVDRLRIDARRGPLFFRSVHREMLGVAGGIDARCYHASDLYVLPAMSEAADMRQAIYTYDARELYPHVSATVRRPWVSWIWSYVEDRHIRGAAVVFTVGRKIAEHLQATYDIRKPIVVRNVPPFQVPASSHRLSDLLNLDREIPVVLHLGQIRKDRGCESLVRAMALFDGGHLAFVGYGSERDRLRALVDELRLTERISFLDPVPPDEVVDVTAGATVGVTLLEDTCLNHRFALPNKLFDYLMAGVPVLASHLPEMRAVVQGYNVGKTVNPERIDDIASAMNALTASSKDRGVWKANAHRFCETFNWENASQRFVKAFHNVLSAGRDAPRADRIRSGHTSEPPEDALPNS